MTVSAKTLNISRELSLPVDFVTKSAAILAQRRKGKTYTASVIAEELVRVGLPWVALDPTGAWWGLRSSIDGKSEGLPIVVLGGDHGHLPISRTDGRVIADLVVDHPGWYVIDFNGFGVMAAEREFATDFAERLYRRKGEPDKDFPLHLFVDEADKFVPQKPSGGRGDARESDQRLLGAFETIVRRGGLRGLGTTLISQRSAVVNKNVLEQIDVLIALRVVGPNDQKRIDEYLRADADDEQRKIMMASLAQLAIGEAWVWEPGADPPLFDRVHVRERTTFNSSVTPKVGEKRVEPSVFAAVDVSAITSQLSASIAKADADDPKKLRAEIARLTKTLRESENRKIAPEIRTKTITETVEVVPPAVATTIHELVKAAGSLSGISARIDAIAANANLQVADADRARRARSETKTRQPVPAVIVPTERAPAPSVVDADPDAKVGKFGLKVLGVLVQHPDGLPRKRLAALAGTTTKKSTLRNALSDLRGPGLIVDLPGDVIQASEAGVARAGDVAPLPTGDELRDYWLDKIGRNGTAGRLLALLIESWPHALDRDDVCAKLDLNPGTSTLRNAASDLRKHGLIGGGFVLSDELGEAMQLPGAL